MSPTRQSNLPFRYAVIDEKKITVDETYQRPLGGFAKQIAENFDPALLNTLALSEHKRRNGQIIYAVIDGQTRLQACRMLGIGELPAVVYHGLTRAQEADLFARFQTERRPVRPFYRFRAQLVAGDAQAKAIDRIVNDEGWTISDAGGTGARLHTTAVGALEAAYKFDPVVLRRTLAVLRDAWKDSPGHGTGDIIRGMAVTLHRNEVDDERLVAKLRGIDPGTVRRRAAALSEGRGQPASAGRANYIAAVIMDEYHRRGRLKAV